ncbi:hypothetical protein Golomagni_06331 [Golovinomyces magnicellulatus]|nr:hypothetical protein Golomagni_06331 [Golovinomyces magnicellulatus]
MFAGASTEPNGIPISQGSPTSFVLHRQQSRFIYLHLQVTSSLVRVHVLTSTKMKLPYVSNPPQTNSPEEDAIVKRVQERRAPRPLQALDLTLLHSPPVADGWNSFLGAIRTKTSLSDDIRELAISRVAVCNQAWYEWHHHAPLAVEGGVSQEALEVVKQDELGTDRPESLDERQWGVLKYTDEMTRNVQVKDETFNKLKELFNNQEVVEITATVAAYNCVSRFLVALDVGERNGTGPEDVTAH